MTFSHICTLLLCVALITPACITTDTIGPNGEQIRLRTIDVAQARDILLLALSAWDLINARIVAYEARGDDISEPDALQLAIAEARAAILRRGIDFLNAEFAQLAPNAKKIRVPVGLMRRAAEAASAETGIPLRMSALPGAHPGVGVKFALDAHPIPLIGVSPNDEPWRFAAAGFTQDL